MYVVSVRLHASRDVTADFFELSVLYLLHGSRATDVASIFRFHEPLSNLGNFFQFSLFSFNSVLVFFFLWSLMLALSRQCTGNNRFG